MTCSQIREAISARLDGEEPGVPEPQIGAHLADCGACCAFAEEARALHRAARVTPAPAVPDMTPRVLAAIGADRTDAAGDPGRTLALRLALAVLAAVQIGLAVPELLGADNGVAVHNSRHLGSFALALAVAFLYAAWRPARVAGLLPVLAVLAVCLIGTSVLDVVGGRTAPLTEAGHVTELAGLLAVWLLAPSRARPPRMAVT